MVHDFFLGLVATGVLFLCLSWLFGSAGSAVVLSLAWAVLGLPWLLEGHWLAYLVGFWLLWWPNAFARWLDERRLNASKTALEQHFRRQSAALH